MDNDNIDNFTLQLRRELERNLEERAFEGGRGDNMSLTPSYVVGLERD